MSVFGTLLFASALGALWALAGLWSGRALQPAPLAVAVAMAGGLRWLGCPAGARTALLAAAGTLLAAGYAQCLFAINRVAAAMGLSFLETLRRIGAGMTAAVARAPLDGTDVAFMLAGAALAALLAWRRMR
ncbi:hypothetical protein MBSD_n2040 [Mizugakiibacter sediminis]|uniref:Uncharacterized protein n=1 Tax=Mizugakiibacter sediminis TaxID=1475481 RepID=A0A0K8QPA3_9GAMM|nr:hypothetical protein MBSD_n2040 [Mizugakiibacter sediminis]